MINDKNHRHVVNAIKTMCDADLRTIKGKSMGDNLKINFSRVKPELY